MVYYLLSTVGSGLYVLSTVDSGLYLLSTVDSGFYLLFTAGSSLYLLSTLHCTGGHYQSLLLQILITDTSH